MCVGELGSDASGSTITHTAKTFLGYELSRHYRTFEVDIKIASRSNFSPHEYFVLFDVFSIEFCNGSNLLMLTFLSFLLGASYDGKHTFT